MLNLLGMIERDANINDVRHAAYMLATVMWETTSPFIVEKFAKNKKGKPLLDKKGHPIVLKQKKWLMTMAPVSEIGQGKGRRYHEPVKIKLMSDGWARITEQDGDQFKVSAGGAITPLTKGAKIGTQDGGAASKTYDSDDGVEHAYFGRGYVQLTWWSNYATAGIAVGRGLALLNDPELVKQPEVAYALMSHGMRTGEGFANGRRFSHYFMGDVSNYAAARRMVNGSDHAEDIAKIARKFEAALLKASSNTPLKNPEAKP
ncbi:glycoside hydrolase family 19 protein [Acidovorax sp. NCPPB 4044]|uniref:glycoside hydrolase family 19 protein n=1 Tax=Acidovorax sp. NCPPB 4044 TaxID=2940490 RepID=UPI0023039A53|nr:glycoside hydrolase family 19 protein [Acidovorax sp. NCPPB 4044]MDA8522731.1 glycoside hydrolase [Acidovorax sp. NCPPB 4044]